MIIGITGTNSAGKGTVVDYLLQKGFTHYSVSREIALEVVRRGMEPTHPNLGTVGTHLREEHGPDYFPDLFIERAAVEGVSNFIVESIRNVQEAENIKKHGGILLVIDADRRLRYERALLRHSDKDRISFEDFCLQEDREMTPKNSSNPAEMNMKAVIEMADYTVLNNGSLEDLHQQMDHILAEIHI